MDPAAEGLRRVGDGDTKAPTAAEKSLDLLAEVGVIDDQFTVSGPRKLFHMVLDQRLATHLEQGLGGMVGQRTHALTTPGGKNHRFPYRLTLRHSGSRHGLTILIRV